MANESSVPLNDLEDTFAKQVYFCSQIISGGQTGVDRAALDFAIKHGIHHGGWAPKGRLAEDGIIPLKYQLQELERGGYRQRTKSNVLTSNGTLILNLGELDGGTLATQVFAQKLKKPYMVVQLDQFDLATEARRVLQWISDNQIYTLNVAGPREGKRRGIYSQTLKFLYNLNESFKI